jgi:hypothetical protein
MQFRFNRLDTFSKLGGQKKGLELTIDTKRAMKLVRLSVTGYDAGWRTRGDPEGRCALANFWPDFVYFLLLMSVAVAVCVEGGVPPLPVTVKRYVPRVVEELTVIFSAEELVAGFGLKLPVAPAGRPLTDKFTGELNPLVGVIVTV